MSKTREQYRREYGLIAEELCRIMAQGNRWMAITEAWQAMLRARHEWEAIDKSCAFHEETHGATDARTEEAGDGD